MKIEIRKEIVTIVSEVIDLKSIANVLLTKLDLCFSGLIKEFCDTDKWKTIGISCHDVFSDLPSYHQGGINGCDIESMIILHFDKTTKIVTIMVNWWGMANAVVMMKQQ